MSTRTIRSRTTELGKRSVAHIFNTFGPPNAVPEVFFVKGEGIILTDADGKEYMDMSCFYHCASLGYGRRELIEAAAVYALPNMVAGPNNLPAIEYAEELAKGGSTEEIILVSITERISGQTRAPEVQELYRASERRGLQKAGSEVSVTFGKKERQAKRYLSKIAEGLESRGIKVRTEVLLGNPAEEIVNSAEHDDISVIIMASHGRSGPSRWAHGSVADKVFRASSVPVLMIRAPGCAPGI